ncbi:hypothetical protein [Natrinema sp. DC36]|uniref:hypothetical protein n=1 Tax=Natrinema sp. DC36 TaxID=2878680 RepID=UPI001CEFF14A|nr:hypothetical protein [Natrinema sp. DC36]
MVRREITGIGSVARLAEYVSAIDRYDLLLGLIPIAFAVAGLAGHVLGLPLEATLLGGVAIASLALFNGLFFRPPNGLQGA